MEFKDFIKNRRIEIGATLEDIAKIVGVSKATVQRWESGNIANIRRDKIVKLAKALNVSPAYLMGWEEEPVFSHPDILPIETKKIPIIGSMACGEPIYEEEDFEAYVVVGAQIKADAAVRAK